MAITISAAMRGTDTAVFRDAMVVRTDVFVHEQSVPVDEEIDDDDPRSWHLVAYDDSLQGAPIATVRLVPPPHAIHAEGPAPHVAQPGNVVKIGRLATLKAARGRGVARKLVDAAVAFAKANPSAFDPTDGGHWDGRFLIHAQTSVKPAWEKMGFVEDPEMGEWVEVGIMHVGMWRTT